MGTRVFGLTGGIASGKSTVGRMFASLGVSVVDADMLAREVVQPGQPALQAIAQAFGPKVFLPDGSLDRKSLASLVFADDKARAKLEAILHPRIREAFQRERAIVEAKGAPLMLYEASLLVETGEYLSLDGLIVVATPLEVQVQRLAARDGLTEEEALRRIRAQAPLATKLAVADYVIDGSAPLKTTREQVHRVLEQILSGNKQGGG